MNYNSPIEDINLEELSELEQYFYPSNNDE